MTICQCEKRQYTSRKRAKKAARRAFPGHHMSAYQCGEGWHIGHLPSRVVAGDKDRADIDRKPWKRKDKEKAK